VNSSDLIGAWVYLTHPWIPRGTLSTHEVYLLARQMIHDATGGAVVS